ncbi:MULTISPECIES: hypothetical protein [Streptomyces]|uniref:Uncharacterized protein n=1 Tax=Streptomyces olivaceiscleroticus TaxID=68245 RepID=A0ABN0ZYB5_9ACTN|nr:hypothetical protein [Streptomyces niger]
MLLPFLGLLLTEGLMGASAHAPPAATLPAAIVIGGCLLAFAIRERVRHRHQ